MIAINIYVIVLSKSIFNQGLCVDSMVIVYFSSKISSHGGQNRFLTLVVLFTNISSKMVIALPLQKYLRYLYQIVAHTLLARNFEAAS